MIARLYENMISGSIDEDTFRTLMQKTQDEQKDLKKQVARDKKRLSDDEALETDTKAWLNEIGTYADIKELDSATINRLVKEIIVHETVKSLSGKRNLTRRKPHRRIRSFTVPVY